MQHNLILCNKQPALRTKGDNTAQRTDHRKNSIKLQDGLKISVKIFKKSTSVQ